MQAASKFVHNFYMQAWLCFMFQGMTEPVELLHHFLYIILRTALQKALDLERLKRARLLAERANLQKQHMADETHSLVAASARNTVMVGTASQDHPLQEVKLIERVHVRTVRFTV